MYIIKKVIDEENNILWVKVKWKYSRNENMEMVLVLLDCVLNYIIKSGIFILKKKFYRIRNIYIVLKYIWLV